MSARQGLRVVRIMASEDKEPVTVDYFERRLAQLEGKLRLEVGALRQEMVDGFGKLRAEIADRNADQLKWLLLFFVAQTGTLAAVVALFR